MAGLQNLKKQLRSIRATGQLAGAMKTVSAAKYSKVGALTAGYSGYADAVRGLREQFGAEFSAALPCADPDAPDCYIVFSSNRGLCGGYHAELFAHTIQQLQESKRPYLLVTCGKMAKNYFEGKKLPIHKAFPMPDVPSFADVEPLCKELLSAYQEGKIASVRLIYQHFQNMLTQIPGTDVMLPFADGGTARDAEDAADIFCLPDRETAVRSAALLCYRSGMYAAVLEAAAGAQAATMMAMRSAYDNAEESSVRLETELNRRRQNEVTASVIETSSE